MAVSFNYIPSNIRTPLFYAEVDNSMANTATADKKTLIIGQMTDGTASVGVPTLISSTTQAMNKFGRGSELALMCEAYINNDPTGTLWVLPMAVEGVQATGSVAIKGTALENGTLSFYVGGTKVAVSVASGDSAQTVATTLVDTITSNKDLPVSAKVVVSEDSDDCSVTFTCKGVGTYGNDIPLGVNRQGATGGEENVSGISLEITAMKGGTGEIDYEDAFTKFNSETFTYICIPGNDATCLDACKVEMNDGTGRWSYARMQYGHFFGAKRGTAEALVTFGNTRNDQHVSLFGIEVDNPEPTWIIAAAITGRSAVFLTNDPARPTQTGELTGLLATSMENRFNFTDRNNLLKNGIATMYVNSGTVRIERSITTYQRNSFGDADNSYLDCETLFTLAEIITRLKTAITSKYARHKLANDGTNYGPGQAIVTPNVIRSELIAQYASMERDGLVENADLFAKYLIVERNSSDVNRIDVLLPPDLVNQLRIFALLAQFRLQYSDNA